MLKNLTFGLGDVAAAAAEVDELVAALVTSRLEAVELRAEEGEADVRLLLLLLVSFDFCLLLGDDVGDADIVNAG